MRKSKTLTSLMCALCLTTSAYAVNIDQGSDLTVDASSRDHIIAGNKLKMKNSLAGIMIGHDLEMENSEMGTSIGVYNTVKGYNSMAIGNHNIADGTNADNSRNWTAIAIGSVCNALSHGNGTSVAMGAEVTADGQDAVAFGYQAKAKGYHAVALGAEAMVFASSGGTAVGSESHVYGNHSLAIGGTTTNVYGKYSIGINAWTVKGDNVIGIGGQTWADDAIAIGEDSNTTVKGGIALGRSSEANIDKGILG